MKDIIIALFRECLVTRREHVALRLDESSVRIQVAPFGYGKVRVSGGKVPDAGYGPEELGAAVEDFLTRVR